MESNASGASESEGGEEDEEDEEEVPLAELQRRRKSRGSSDKEPKLSPWQADASTNTGGIGTTGRVVKGEKKVSFGDDVQWGALVQRMKVTLPMLKAATMDGTLRDLLVNLLVHDTWKKGERLYLPKGITKEEISEGHLLQQRDLLSKSLLASR